MPKHARPLDNVRTRTRGWKRRRKFIDNCERLCDNGEYGCAWEVGVEGHVLGVWSVCRAARLAARQAWRAARAANYYAANYYYPTGAV